MYKINISKATRYFCMPGRITSKATKESSMFATGKSSKATKELSMFKGYGGREYVGESLFVGKADRGGK